MIEKYVQVLHPGIIVADTSESKCHTRDPRKYKMPKHAYGFRFFNKEVLEGTTGKVYGEPHDYSPWYYKGTVRTIGQVKAQEPDSILYRNMTRNNVDRIVDTEFGQSIPLEDDDVVL